MRVPKGSYSLQVEVNRSLLVPLVLVFTKFDLIVPKVSSNTPGGNDYRRVRAAHEGKCRSLFGDVPAEIVSGDYSFVCLFLRKSCLTTWFVSAWPGFRDLIDKLVQTTDRLILSHSPKIAASPEAQRTQPRMSLVPLAWSVSQRASRDINILTAIERVTSFLLMSFLSHTVRQSWAKQ